MKMQQFELETAISEANISAHKTKAIADAFAHEYIDVRDFHVTALQLETNPDSFIYLFTAMMDSLFETCKQLDELNSAEIQKEA